MIVLSQRSRLQALPSAYYEQVCLSVCFIFCGSCHCSGPLRSIMKDLHSDDNEEESDEAEDNDNDSEMERPVNRGGSRSRR